MSWLNRFNKNESALSDISKKIYEYSVFCAEPLKQELEKTSVKNSNEYLHKYTKIFYEFMFFFMHFTNRAAFVKLGQEKRAIFQDRLYSIVVDSAIETIFKNRTKELKNTIKDKFYKDLGNAETDYSACKILFLKPEDDADPLSKLVGGEMVKSQGMLNLLIDRLSEIISGQTMNTDVLFPLLIIDNVLNTLKKDEINGLVLKASKEL